MKQGIIFLIVAPSGAGKSSLVKELLKNNSDIDLSISYTTRAMRVGEVQGREYHFIDKEKFLFMQKSDEFIEYALVHGNYYGTSRIWLEKELRQNKKILLEIDWQGANQVKQIFSSIANIVYIFILPPSIQELEQRLLMRGQDSQDIIQTRIAGAKIEVKHALDADYIIINENFNFALDEIQSIIKCTNLLSSIQYTKHCKLMQGLNI